MALGTVPGRPCEEGHASAEGPDRGEPCWPPESPGSGLADLRVFPTQTDVNAIANGDIVALPDIRSTSPYTGRGWVGVPLKMDT